MISRLRIDDFSYPLHDDHIAAYPLKQRDTSKLLVYRGGLMHQASFSQVADFLDKGSMLVVNNTRVVQARLVFYKNSGARVEVFCLEPLHPVTDVHVSLGLRPPVVWKCLVGNAKKWKTDALSMIANSGNTSVRPATSEARETEEALNGCIPEMTDADDQSLVLRAEMLTRTGEEYEIRFSWDPADLSFAHILDHAGMTPLPPYINRKSEPEDKKTYQTVFAQDEGSVAAPTAGLHFTPGVFDTLHKKDITTHQLTLHVGAGTFKPVNTETIDGHQMHREQFHLHRNMIEALRKHQGQVTSVGTTSMRTLESLYWIGAKLLQGYVPKNEYVVLEQWTPYQYKGPLPSKEMALEAILRWMDKKHMDVLRGETSMIIVPGFRFHIVDALITNFHQPRSTLLLLVAAFAGPGWRDVYQYALEHNFRFLSYGDSCLFFRQPATVDSGQ